MCQLDVYRDVESVPLYSDRRPQVGMVHKSRYIGQMSYFLT